MTIHAHSLRVFHKWTGLIIGIQFLLWTLSGAMMALLDMEEVAGGRSRAAPPAEIVRVDRWPEIRRQLDRQAILGLSLRPLLGRQIYQVSTAGGERLFDASSGERVTVSAIVASHVASAAHPENAPIKSVTSLDDLPLAVREHSLPIWQVDFADDRNSTYFVSGATGELLERRNDTWRLWDFFWMLHIMDYSNRASFNHPLIITLGFAAVWLAVTGVWLLFRTGWRSDFKRFNRR